jgi:SAM-dependent methyltransferase
VTDGRYQGTELTVFANAVHWKRYFGSVMRPYFGKRVVEVGAGLGATSRVLAHDFHGSWLCLEPDTDLCTHMEDQMRAGGWPPSCQVQHGFLSSLPASRQFDTILYIDVLEHIEHDAQEIEGVRNHLSRGGHLVILVPAHMALYSPFDRAVGHFRRYNRPTLRAAVPADFVLQRLYYLDSVGFLASLANRLLLRSGHPTAAQIKLWDRVLVPMSQRIDPLLGYRFGKSLLGVWRLET